MLGRDIVVGAEGVEPGEPGAANVGDSGFHDIEQIRKTVAGMTVSAGMGEPGRSD